MSKKQLYFIITGGFLGLILLVFFFTGRRNNDERNTLDLSVLEEEILLADMQELDSLFLGLESADLKNSKNSTLQASMSWEKTMERFSAKHRSNPVSFQIAGLVLANYRSRMEMMRKEHFAKSAASVKAERIEEAILVEQAKNDALKTDNILIKEALLKL